MSRAATQFTIRGLQIVVLGAACVLAIWLYADPLRYWRELLAVLFCPLMSAIMLLIVFGPRRGQVFGLGFIVGFVVEFLAMTYCTSHGLLRFSATSLAPLGWYPLEIPIQRFLLLNGLARAEAASVLARFAALVVSGALCGAVVFVAGGRMWHFIKGRRRSHMRLNQNDHIHGSLSSVSASKFM